MKRVATIATVLIMAQPVMAETDSVQGPDGRMIHETSCQFSNKDCYQEARQTSQECSDPQTTTQNCGMFG